MLGVRVSFFLAIEETGVVECWKNGRGEERYLILLGVRPMMLPSWGFGMRCTAPLVSSRTVKREVADF